MFKSLIHLLLVICSPLFSQDLQIKLEIPKEIFRFGELIDVEISVENISDHIVKLPRPLYGNDMQLKLSSQGKNLDEAGPKVVLHSKKDYVIAPNEEHYYHIILNERFGKFYNPEFNAWFLIESGEYQLHVELDYKGNKIESNTLTFKVQDATVEESYIIEEFKKFLDWRNKTHPEIKASALKLEKLLESTDKAFKARILLSIATVWDIVLRDQKKAYEIYESILYNNPNSFLGIQISQFEEFKEKHSSTIEQLITNKFYKKYYLKIISEK